MRRTAFNIVGVDVEMGPDEAPISLNINKIYLFLAFLTL